MIMRTQKWVPKKLPPPLDCSHFHHPLLSQITASGEAKCHAMRTSRQSCWTGPLRGTEASGLRHENEPSWQQTLHPFRQALQIRYRLGGFVFIYSAIHDTTQNLQS